MNKPTGALGICMLVAASLQLQGCGFEHDAFASAEKPGYTSTGTHADMVEVCANVPSDDDAVYFVKVHENNGVIRDLILPMYDRGAMHCGVINELHVSEVKRVELRCQHISCVNVTKFLIRPRFSDTGKRDPLAASRLVRTGDTSVSMTFAMRAHPVPSYEYNDYDYDEDYDDVDIDEYDSLPYDGDQPDIRVGLVPLRAPVRFISAYSYVATGSDGERVSIGSRRRVRISCGNVECRLTVGRRHHRSNRFWRLEPKSYKAHFKITNMRQLAIKKYEKRIKKNPEYRGALEVRITRKGKWVINELPLEFYLAGLGELPESFAYQAHKAQQVAARTYAYYMLKSGGRELSSKRHRKRDFHLRATAHDQVYLGLRQERRAKRSRKAARATAGELVTYRGRVVPTFYFAHSDGYTKSAHRVWGGKRKPWLIRVRAEYDDGKSMFGHGVGLSQWDAAKRARAEGLDYHDLLAYYYRGTDVEKSY